MVKQKPRHQAKRKQSLTSFDGIPRLQRTISETGPSETEHASVRFAVRPYGVAFVTLWDESKILPNLQAMRVGSIVYSTKNDIAGVVKTFVTSIIIALDLEEDVGVDSEIGMFNIRPVLLAVTVYGIPVGVIEVKKPDVPGGVAALDHPNVLGELFNFMKLLQMVVCGEAA